MKEVTKLYVVKAYVPGSLFLRGQTIIYDLTTDWIHEPHKRWEMIARTVRYNGTVAWWVE